MKRLRIFLTLLFLVLNNYVFAQSALSVTSGTTTFSSGSHTFTDITVTSPGILVITGTATVTATNSVTINGTVDINGTSTFTAQSCDINVSSTSTSVIGVLNIGGNAIVSTTGTFIDPTKSTVTDGFNINVSNLGQINSSGAIGSGASINITGNINLTNSAVFNINQSSRINFNRINSFPTCNNINVNNGAKFVVNSGELYFSGNNINVGPGGRMYVQNSSYIVMGDQTAIALQSDYTTVNWWDQIQGGILNVTTSSVITGNGTNAVGWFGISVSGGNGTIIPLMYSAPHGPNSASYVPQSPGKAAIAIFSNATIADSYYGVCNWDAFSRNEWGELIDNDGKATGGGDINAMYTTFSGNATSAEFAPYNDNVDAGGMLIDRSSFRNCTFNFSGLPWYFVNEVQGFVIADKVEGLDFISCTFDDTYNRLSNLSGSISLNPVPAVSLTDAGATFDEACTCAICSLWPVPSCYPIGNSSFTNISTIPISANNTSPQIHKLTIQNTTFTGIHGDAIDVSGYAYCRIGANHITLGSNNLDASSNPIASVAVSIQGCTGYEVVSNIIDGSASSLSYGVEVNNSMGNPNIVYQNTISNTTEAIEALGPNYSQTNTTSGLNIECNDLTGNTYTKNYNIYVGNMPGQTSGGGIALVQGDISNPNLPRSQNNLYSAITTPNHFDYNFANNTLTTPIVYYYATSDDPTNNYNISLHTAYSLNACPSYYSYLPGQMSVSTAGNDQASIATRLAGTTPGVPNSAGIITYDALITQYAQVADSAIKSALYGSDSLAKMTGDSSRLIYNTDTLRVFMNDSSFKIVTDTLLTVTADTAIVFFDSISTILSNMQYLPDYQVWKECRLAGPAGQL